ncbi:hypothetical protein BRADI_3g39235v3 [Brachypodium distachyon]|uniref:DUF1618 domain-containing protein n=1 Tax=Brachypodium distachyon TaxID=15368 RepID=A0A0Q3FKS9_BRADI|nr:hypothetical protein BRADI_3g39235v3 [Brachypodium distachyon]
MLDRFVHRTKGLSPTPVELSSASTRSPAQESDRSEQRTEPPAAAMLLDRFIYLTKGDEPRDEVADGTLSSSSVAFTCIGDPIAVSLTIAEPPELSRLFHHWPQGLRPEMREMSAPSVFAAHGRSILFEAYVPLADCCNPEYYPFDCFLYTAGSGIRSPVLRRLPTCFIGGLVDPVGHQYYVPHRLQEQRPMSRSDVGLLCRGEEDEFVVASLMVDDPMANDNKLCVLHHSPAEKKKIKWRLKKLPVPSTDGPPPVPQQPPRYVSLPERLLRHRRLYMDGFGCVDPARNVTWTLVNFENDSRWEQDASYMKAEEFWAALQAADKQLPCVRPEYPTMNLVHPHVIYLTLEASRGIFWLIEVDMKKNVIFTPIKYSSGRRPGTFGICRLFFSLCID